MKMSQFVYMLPKLWKCAPDSGWVSIISTNVTCAHPCVAVCMCGEIKALDCVCVSVWVWAGVWVWVCLCLCVCLSVCLCVVLRLIKHLTVDLQLTASYPTSYHQKKSFPLASHPGPSKTVNWGPGLGWGMDKTTGCAILHQGTGGTLGAHTMTGRRMPVLL